MVDPASPRAPNDRYSYLIVDEIHAKLPLARKFPGKRKYWALAGKMPGNPFWKEIDRKYNELPG
jgi:hypothetical protein